MKIDSPLWVAKKPQQFTKLLNRAKVPQLAQISLEMALILGIILHLFTRLAIAVWHGPPSGALVVLRSGRIGLRNFGDGL